MSPRGASCEDCVPDEIWVSGPDGFFLVPLRREDDPRRWSELCRGDQMITIQVDDGTDRFDRDEGTAAIAPIRIRPPTGAGGPDAVAFAVRWYP